MVLPLTDLTEQERAQAMERFDVLRPVLEGREQLATIANQHQLSLRTCNDGYSAITPRA